MRFGARHGPTHLIGSVLVWFGALVICFLSCSHFAFCGTQSCRLIGSDWAGSCAGDSGLRARTGFPQRRRYFRHGKTLCFVSSAASNYRAETPGKPNHSRQNTLIAGQEPGLGCPDHVSPPSAVHAQMGSAVTVTDYIMSLRVATSVCYPVTFDILSRTYNVVCSIIYQWLWTEQGFRCARNLRRNPKLCCLLFR